MAGCLVGKGLLKWNEWIGITLNVNHVIKSIMNRDRDLATAFLII